MSARQLDLAETTVEQAMHPGVLTCPPGTPLRDAALMMARYRIHAVVVFGDSDETDEAAGIWGVVSDSDLVAALAVDDVEDRTAGGTATTPHVTIGPDETLQRAAELMKRHGVTHLVVVRPESDRPLGIVSSLDLAAALAD